MPTTVVVNGAQINFALPKTYADNKTPLPASAITSIRVAVGQVSGGPYGKSVQDTALTPDASGVCHVPLASLGVDLSVANFAVLFTEIVGGESLASAEVGFQNLLPNPPQAISVS